MWLANIFLIKSIVFYLKSRPLFTNKNLHAIIGQPNNTKFRKLLFIYFKIKIRKTKLSHKNREI